MVEPATVVGTAGAAAGIIGSLAAAIKYLYELRGRWTGAGFALENLIAQLVALKAALQRIDEWMQSATTAELHHQLVMDLGSSIACCRHLVAKMESCVSRLHQDTQGRLVNASKVKFIFGATSVDTLQKMLERQTNAMTLMLTVCNW